MGSKEKAQRNGHVACGEVMEWDTCASEGQSPIHNRLQALQRIVADATCRVMAQRTSRSPKHIDQQKLSFQNCLQARARKKILRKLKPVKILTKEKK